MSSYVKKTIKCMCCGKKNELRLLKGYLADGPMDLDTNPHNPSIFDRVVMCPYCGYATSEPYTAIDDTICDLVKGDDYTAIFENNQYDDTSKKLSLAGYLAAEGRNFKEAGYNYLYAYWYFKEKSLPDANKMCENAVTNFGEYLVNNADFDIALIVIDCLRQLGHFNEAMETAISLEDYLVNADNLKTIVLFEKELIKKSDSDTHKISEVTF